MAASVETRQTCPVMSMSEARRVLRMRNEDMYDLIRSGVLVTFRRGRRRFCTDTALRKCIERIEAEGRIDET